MSIKKATASRSRPAAAKPPGTIPDRGCWIAQDSAGAWWCYAVEPLRNDTGWYENEVGRFGCLASKTPDDWQDSLARVR